MAIAQSPPAHAARHRADRDGMLMPGFGNQNLKIGAPIELEGTNFRVIGSVTGLKLGAT